MKFDWLYTWPVTHCRTWKRDAVAYFGVHKRCTWRSWTSSLERPLRSSLFSKNYQMKTVASPFTTSNESPASQPSVERWKALRSSDVQICTSENSAANRWSRCQVQRKSTRHTTLPHSTTGGKYSRSKLSKCPRCAGCVNCRNSPNGLMNKTFRKSKTYNQSQFMHVHIRTKD